MDCLRSDLERSWGGGGGESQEKIIRGNQWAAIDMSLERGRSLQG